MAKRLTKAEKEAREAEAQAARLREALRWTDPAPGPDVPPPDSRTSRFGELTTGYVFNVHVYEVWEACSSSTGHATGRTDRTTTQNPIKLYSTRLRALRSLRSAMERKFAEELEKIDRMIEREEANS